MIAADLQGHARTGDIDRPITYEALGDDSAALMKNLGSKRLTGWATRSARAQHDYPTPGSRQKARRRLNGLQKRWVVSRNSQRDGAVRACRRRAVEAESVVSDLFTHRTDPGELARAGYQEGQTCCGRTSTGRKTLPPSRRQRRSYLAMRTPSAPNMWCSSSNSYNRRREEGWRAGMDQEFPTRGWPFCLA